jgi:hypothetical protein
MAQPQNVSDSITEDQSERGATRSIDQKELPLLLYRHSSTYSWTGMITREGSAISAHVVTQTSSRAGLSLSGQLLWPRRRRTASRATIVRAVGNHDNRRRLHGKRLATVLREEAAP